MKTFPVDFPDVYCYNDVAYKTALPIAKGDVTCTDAERKILMLIKASVDPVAAMEEAISTILYALEPPLSSLQQYRVPLPEAVGTNQ